MLRATPRWTLSLGIVVAALLSLAGWTLFTRSKRPSLSAASADIVGSEATGACPVVVPANDAGDRPANNRISSAIPELDRRQPDDFETATFAMG